MPESRVVILTGPTAAGKSALALRLAKRLGGEIINADSRQVYAGMDIGTDKRGSRHEAVGSGKTTTRCPLPASIAPANISEVVAGAGWPTAHTRDEPMRIAGIPHYLLDILTPDQQYSAAEFRDDALRIIADIQRRGKLPIVVGGTGFYLRVLTDARSLPNVPPDPAFRRWAEEQPLEKLVGALQKESPELAAKVDSLRNRRRVTRYLEIARARGSGQWTPTHASRGLAWEPGAVGSGDSGQTRTTASCLLPHAWNTLKLALVPPWDILKQRIEARVDAMLERGLVDEVRRLVASYGADAPGLLAVGYRQVLPLLRGEQSLAETRAGIIRAHRQYARRQLTWLKKEPGVVRVASPEEADAYVELQGLTPSSLLPRPTPGSAGRRRVNEWFKQEKNESGGSS